MTDVLGFQGDPSFRWRADRRAVLDQAHKVNATQGNRVRRTLELVASP